MSRVKKVAAGKPCNCGSAAWRWDSDLCSRCDGVLPSEVDAELAKVVAWLRSLETWEEAAGLADDLERHAHRKETR